jgi:AcrR family transcriptional regulator
MPIKNKILEANLKLMCQLNYDKVSAREIGRKIKIAHTTVIYHFPDRKTLICESLRYFIQKEIIQTATSQNNLTLTSLIAISIKAWSQHPNMPSNFQRAFTEDNDIKKEIFKTNQEAIKPVIKSILRKSDIEIYYAIYLSLTFHPFLSFREGETLLAPVKLSEALEDIMSIQ